MAKKPQSLKPVGTEKLCHHSAESASPFAEAIQQLRALLNDFFQQAAESLPDAHRFRLLTLYAPLLLLALMGCEDEGALTRVSSEGKFNPSAVDFGQVPVGTARCQIVQLL